MGEANYYKHHNVIHYLLPPHWCLRSRIRSSGGEGNKELSTRELGPSPTITWPHSNSATFFFLAMPCNMQDLSSLTRDPNQAPCK